MAKGKVLKSGDRAYGKYQIMGSNIRAWSYEALHRSLTINEFLGDSHSQDLIAQYKMDQYLKKYNQLDVISIWFTGQPLKGNEKRRDVNGTTAESYVRQVLALIN